MTALPHARTALLTLYDAKLACRGFVLNRGRGGCKAFDTDTKSIGIFATRHAAIDAAFAAGAHHEHG
jgi:hypothetical protein